MARASFSGDAAPSCLTRTPHAWRRRDRPRQTRGDYSARRPSFPRLSPHSTACHLALRSMKRRMKPGAWRGRWSAGTTIAHIYTVALRIAPPHDVHHYREPQRGAPRGRRDPPRVQDGRDDRDETVARRSAGRASVVTTRAAVDASVADAVAQQDLFFASVQIRRHASTSRGTSRRFQRSLPHGRSFPYGSDDPCVIQTDQPLIPRVG